MSQKKLKAKEELRLMIPRLAPEANQLKDQAARRRWMKLRKIALSRKDPPLKQSPELKKKFYLSAE